MEADENAKPDEDMVIRLPKKVYDLLVDVSKENEGKPPVTQESFDKVMGVLKALAEEIESGATLISEDEEEKES